MNQQRAEELEAKIHRLLSDFRPRTIKEISAELNEPYMDVLKIVTELFNVGALKELVYNGLEMYYPYRREC